MLRFEAVVRPQKAEVVCLRLLEAGFVDELEAREILGSGRRADGPTELPVIDTLPKAMIAGYIEDEDTDALIDLICTHARTGRIGDGKLWLYRVEAIAG